MAHAVPGLVVVAGGKWTTYRVMAKDAIDEAVAALDGRTAESVTENIGLLGAEGYQAAWNKRGKIARAFGIHKFRVEHLLERYGVLTDELLDLIRARPELLDPLPGADDYIGAGQPRGRTAPGRRARAPHAHLDRVVGSRNRGGAGRRAADG